MKRAEPSTRWVEFLVLAFVLCVTALHARATEQQPRVAPRPEATAFGDWQVDAPGVRHKIEAADLPAPYATQPVAHPPRIVPPPPGAVPKVPAGFEVTLFASGLVRPRLMRVAPNGDVFVAETAAGRIRILKSGAAGALATLEVYATGLSQPFGIAFYPRGPDPDWVYVANTGSVVRFPYRSGDQRASGPPEMVVEGLPTGGHTTRDVAFSRDGGTMFVSVGSASNVAEDMEPMLSREAMAWDREHGAKGAAWGEEAFRADVLAFDPQGKGRRIFATGIRNCVGLAVHPASGDLWCSTNERDMLGDDLVPDYVTRVRPGGFYGWPWYYSGDHEDPRRAGERPDLKGKGIVPDVMIQPHSASLQMTFYEGALFPPAYRGNAFVAEHGSWNRSKLVGYKVIRIVIKDGVPTRDYEDFMTGFVIDDDHVWGRPVGVAVAKDGALLVSDDANGLVWRAGAK